MKKINSIGFGPTMIKLAGLLLLVIPAVLFISSELLGFNGVIRILIYASVIFGIVILLALAVILFIELRQDDKINSSYRSVYKTKILLSNGLYECQHCGNCTVKSSDNSCLACGITFENRNRK